MVDFDAAGHFLVERGLIGPDWIIDESLTLRSEKRRNQNLRVEGPGFGFLVKQPNEKTGTAPGTLRREARFLEYCRDQSTGSPPPRYIPRLVHYSPEQALLAVELIPNAMTLWSYLELQSDHGLGVVAGRALGRALGSLHRSLAQSNVIQEPRIEWLESGLPWAMTAHRPGPGMLASLSPANNQLLRILQTEPGLSARLDRICQEWRPSTVIHGDIKLDNVLVTMHPEPPEDAGVEIWIVDWEMVQFGDPAWDLAGALQDFLIYWVTSMPLSNELTVEEMVAGARVPLASVRSATRALWLGYRGEARLEPASANAFLLRAVKFSAARLIQSAYERLYNLDRLAGPAVLLLQMSANLLAEPDRGQLHLYGIPLEYASL